MDRKEFYEKYGEEIVSFSNYYKFSFTYEGRLEDGSIIQVDVGGNSDEIYRMDVSAGDSNRVIALTPYAGRVMSNGEEVASFYDY